MKVLLASGGLSLMHFILYDKIIELNTLDIITYNRHSEYLNWHKTLSLEKQNKIQIFSREEFNIKTLRQKLSYDIFILKERSFLSLYLAVLAKIKKKRIYLVTDMCGCLSDKHAQSFFWPLRRLFFDSFFRPSIIAMSYAAYVYYWNKEKPCIFIPYNIFYKLNDNSRCLDVNREEVKFIFIGRLVKDKGINFLCEYILKLANKYPNIKLKLTLVGKEFPEFKIPNDERIDYLGFVDNYKLQNIIKNNHVLVLPSKGDTFGIPIVEALACGVPVIATKRTGAVLSHLMDRVNGLLIDDTTQLLSALEEYIVDFELRKRLQNNARSFVCAFDNLPLAERYFKFLDI